MSIDTESTNNNTSSTNHELQNDLRQIMKENEQNQPTRVTQCSPEDIPLLKAEMPYGPSNYHEMALQDQMDGKSRYLIAHKGNKPVGHGNLLLNGPKESELAEVLAGIPEINGIEIKQEFRSQGIGSEIINSAEQIASNLGKVQICMGVHEDNLRARELYESLGYSDRGLPRHKITEGEDTFEGIYLVKDLVENR